MVREGDASCDGNFAVLDETVHADLAAPPAACTCTCEPSGVPTCATSSEIRQYENGNCGGALHDDWDVGTTCNASVAAGAGTSVRALNVVVEGVTCDPEFTEEIEPAGFARDLVLCATDQPLDACETDAETGVCAPALDEPAGELCIWREGDFPCAEGWAGARYLHYRDFIDERACSECTCDEFYGTCTGLTIHLHATNSCNEAPVAGVSPGTCEALGNQGATAARRSGAGTPQVDCSRNAGGGEPIGSAGPIAPVTVCCLTR